MNNDERDEKLIEIHTAVTVIAGKVDNHGNTLYGNGSPGLVKEVTLLTERQDSCVARKAASIDGRRLRVSTVVMFITIAMAVITVIFSVIQLAH